MACVERLAQSSGGAAWSNSSSSFQNKSGAKGRSKAHRLNDLLRELLALMRSSVGFVITWTWIATEENADADHLTSCGLQPPCPSLHPFAVRLAPSEGRVR